MVAFQRQTVTTLLLSVRVGMVPITLLSGCALFWKHEIALALRRLEPDNLRFPCRQARL